MELVKTNEEASTLLGSNVRAVSALTPGALRRQRA